MARPRVIFFGTGPVAAASLTLLTKWAEVEAVVTKPKPPHHKGSFPVLDVAQELSLDVHLVTDKRSLSDLILTNAFQSQLAVLIDFGIIVSQAVIDYFPLGIVNSHFSLLPEWRGADPITFSILSGQPKTGVSLMLLTAGMDEGPILSTNPYDIPPDETVPGLTQTLIEISDQALQHILPGYLAGIHKAIDQYAICKQLADYPAEATYSRKLTKADSLLDFTKPAAQLEREIRAFIDWPKSRTAIAGRDVVITKAHVAAGSGPAGTLWRQDKQIGFYTANGVLVIDMLKPAGKAEMTALAFLAGYGQHL